MDWLVDIKRKRHLACFAVEFKINIAQQYGFKSLEEKLRIQRTKILADFDAKYPHIKFKGE